MSQPLTSNLTDGALDPAIDIAELLINRYCATDGLLARSVDCRLGRIVDSHPLVDELGDYAQYVCLLGQQTGRPALVDWAINQARASFKACSDSGGFLYLDRTSGVARKVRFFSAVRMGDAIWGLAELFRLTADADIGRAFVALTELMGERVAMGGMPVYGALVFGRNRALKIPLSEPMTAGYLCEAMIEHSRDSSDRRLLDHARAIIDAWFEHSARRDWPGYFLRTLHGPLAFVRPMVDLQFRLRKRPGLESNILTKGDVFLLFAVLNAWRVDRDPVLERRLRRWPTFIASAMTADDGRFFNHYDSITRDRDSIALEENHSIIELLIDIAYDLGDEQALSLARRAVDGWRKKVTKLGLYANRDGSKVAEIDPIVDLSINMSKLAELTGSDHYHEWAAEAWAAVLKYFREPFGYCQRIHSETGDMLSTVTETKFLGLLCKGFLVRNLLAKNGKIMASRESRLLASDR